VTGSQIRCETTQARGKPTMDDTHEPGLTTEGRAATRLLAAQRHDHQLTAYKMHGGNGETSSGEVNGEKDDAPTE